MRGRIILLGTCIVALALASIGSSAIAALPAASDTDATIGTAPAAAAKVMGKPAYANARWLYYVADRKTGKVLLAHRADELVFTGSTAKNFTVGSAYEALGPGTRLTTPVVATTPVADGAVAGDLVLVASGDLALGGRGGLDEKFNDSYSSTTVDHIYADIAPNASVTGDDPLAGVNELARQVAAKGVTRVEGDVVVDTRLWEPFMGSEGPIGPVYVNDNLVDVQVKATAEGEPATITVTPRTGAYTIAVDVKTVGAKDDTALSVGASDADPHALTVSGTIASGHSQLTTYRVPDPAAWARTLFIEALGRAGVIVAAPALAGNDESSLPPSDALGTDQPLASIQSPPISAMGRMIVETSYNAGANAFLCLMAVKCGSTDCTDGLKTMDDLVVKAGLDPKAVFLIDGQGADPASTTPRQVSGWMRWARGRPWGKLLYGDQPILGKTGSLAANGQQSPAKGKVHAKVGTSVAVDPVSGRLFSKVQSLAGYMTLDDGREVVFGLSVSGATYPQVYDGLVQAGDDVADVAAAFQQSLSK